MEIKDSETHYTTYPLRWSSTSFFDSQDEFSILAKGRSDVVQDVEVDCAVRAECLHCCAGHIHWRLHRIVEVAIRSEQ